MAELFWLDADNELFKSLEHVKCDTIPGVD